MTCWLIPDPHLPHLRADFLQICPSSERKVSPLPTPHPVLGSAWNPVPGFPAPRVVVLTLESLPGSDPQGQGLKLGKEEEGPQLGRRWREGAGVGGELKTNTGAGAPVPGALASCLPLGRKRPESCENQSLTKGPGDSLGVGRAPSSSPTFITKGWFWGASRTHGKP